MSYFDRDKRFDELFNRWFDDDFRWWLVRERHWAEHSPGSETNPYLRGAAQAYAWVDEMIDNAILEIRDQVDEEFDEWKEWEKEKEKEEE